MNKNIFICTILFVCFNVFTSINKSIAQPLAFPGAVGFGKNVTGGRNGTVYHVTNLNDAGAGSFRDAVSASNRIIVFDVSGYINLVTAVSCKSNLTIAGQTAPGEGIGLRGGKISFGSQSNIIIRYVRIRPGSEVASNEDVGINLVDAKNIIVDHCSIEFAPWNNIGGVSTNWQTKPVQNITFQNCLIANPTYQQFGAHIECPSGTWTWAYNIFANSHNRNPLDKINDIFINNVLYNCSAGYTTHTSTNFQHDIINNYFVKGPASTGTDNQWYQVDKNQSIYYSGNMKDGTLDGVLNGSGTTPSWYQGPGTILTAPWSAETANIPTYSAATAFRYTSSFSGTFPYDEMDRLIISQVRTVAGGTTGYTAGTRGPDGGLYTTQTQTGLGNNGYGTIVTGTRPTDTDNDGMPDFWEKAFGLNVNSNDAMSKGSDGYANIEKYINWLAEPHTQTNQNTAVSIDLSAYTGGFTKVSPVHSIVSASNGTAVIASNGKTATFTPTSNFSGMGSFKFKVTGSDGTEFTFTVYIVVIPTGAPCTAPTATLTSAGATTFCQGSNVVLNANTGTGLTYQWKNGTTIISGATAASYTATASGSYTVVVTNAANCSATSSAISVTVTALPTAAITSSSGTVIPYGGSLALNASTGTGYTYQWKRNNTNISGATASSYTATTAGSYTVTVTASSCSATSSATVLTAETPPLKYIYIYDNSGNLSWSNTNSWTPKAVPRNIDTVIVRTGEVQIANLNHTAPVYVETNGILRLIDTSTVADLRLQGGTLKAYTSAPGMMLTSNITVEQPSTIMAGSVAATIFTINGTITGNANLTKTSVGNLRINATATNFKGNWIITDGKIQLRSASGLGICGVQVKSAARLDIEVAGASIYSLVVETGGGVDLDQPLTTTVAVLGTTNISSGAYQNAAYPTFIGSTSTLNVSNSLVGLSGPTAFCQGNSLILTASSGASYIWKNNSTQVGTAAAYTTTAAGSYTVDATSAAGCKVTSAPVATTITAAPTATITTSSNDMCSGTSVLLTASSGTSYKWFNGTTQVGTAATYTATAAGSYTVEITNAAGCKATSAVTQITGSLQLTPTITAPANAICSGASVVLTSSSGASYKWFNGTTQVGTASTYTATTAGSYTVEVTNTGGCKATSATTQITVSASPTATITSSATSFCTGSSATLTASTGTSYKWFNGTTQVGTAAAYTATAAGTYTVEITNTSGCKATSNPITITIATAQQTPTITTPSTSFCEDGSSVLTASSGASYKWFNGTTQVGTGITYTATDDGSYTVEVTNAAGCKATSAATTITTNPLPIATITAPSTSFCTGTSVTLTSSTGTSYKWFNGTTQVGTSSVYTASTAGSYTVEVTNANGCKATSTPSTITENTTAIATPTITASNTSMCAGGSAILSSSSAATYKWFNGTTQVGTSSAYTATAAGTYTVEVTNSSGCKATSAAIQITIASATIWYQDTDGDGDGDPSSTLTACSQPTGYVSTAGDACPNDENKSEAGNCGCGNSEASCADCAGVINGTAFLDNCSICVGGTTGNTACVTTATVNGTSANITVVPQPFDVNTTITAEHYGMITSFTIISASGAIVETRHGLNTTEITLGDSIASGLYTVILTTEQGTYTTKIVKK